MTTEIRTRILSGDVLTIEVPGLTAVRIDTRNRLIAIDGISGISGGTETGGESLSPEWAVRDLRDGTYGDFHRLKPAGQCNDPDCAKRGEHAGPAAALSRDAHGFASITCGSCGDESSTNCDDDDISCGLCEARRCPCCGQWFGGE